MSDPHSIAALRLLILIEIEHVEDLAFAVNQQHPSSVHDPFKIAG